MSCPKHGGHQREFHSEADGTRYAIVIRNILRYVAIKAVLD